MTGSVEAKNFRRVRKVLEAALELPPEQRSPYLQKTCAGDDALYQRVAALLAADARDASPIDEPIADLALHLLGQGQADAQTGRRIGAHRLLASIGHGGMGSIYLAERADGEYQEQVAIKLIRPGLSSEALIDRFRQERQILAQLNHPNIGRILDGGVTEDGQPYFVMEHIEGEPIDRYCAAGGNSKLPPSRRQLLELFAEVCDAVHAAHRNLIIHCDLKPSNILVTADGVPKLLDFGIARPAPKTLGRDRSEKGTATPTALTPDYASPEQQRGETLTTASDIFSLGVVLHLLLKGRLPSATEKSVSEPALKADLRAILRCALAQEPDQRYSSAREFGADLRRHIEHLPVTAQHPTWTYRAGKFLRRRWLAATLTCLILASAAAGFFATLHQAELARARGQQAERAFDFLVDVFVASDPDEAGGPTDLALIQLLDEAAARTPEEFTDAPPLQARLMDVIGMVYSSLGRYEEAEPLLRQALELRQESLSDNHEDLAVSLDHLGLLQISRGQLEEAELYLDKALSMRRELLGSSHEAVADSLHRLGRLRRSQDRLEEAETSYREALSLRRALLGKHKDVAVTLNNLGVVLRSQGRLDEAEEVLREAAELFEELLGPEHWRLGNTQSNLALVLKTRRQYPEAMALYRHALEIQRRHLGGDHPELANTLNNLAVVLFREGNLDEAEASFREALEIQVPRLGEDHLRVASIRRNLGMVLLDQPRLSEAEALLRRSLRVFTAKLDSDSPDIESTQSGLGRVLAAAHRHGDAEVMLRASLESRQRRGASPYLIAVASTRLAASLTALGRQQEAVQLLRPALATLEDERGDQHPRTLEARAALATAETKVP
ncbi:MAG: serine/threonine-protein kinase [Deltaproteobacteria bacterium]|nr:serine/threonine-protein kinase [Deltaproteobacteria bacterium]